MGDKKDEPTKKKNAPPIAKTVKRKKKKGPSVAVKVPQGMVNLLYFRFSYERCSISCGKV